MFALLTANCSPSDGALIFNSDRDLFIIIWFYQLLSIVTANLDCIQHSFTPTQHRIVNIFFRFEGALNFL